jgi:hypothetical protein
MRKTVVAVATVVAALAVTAPAAFAQGSEPIACNGTLTGVVRGDVHVSTLEDCTIEKAYVTGSITTQTRANSLRIKNSVIVGGVDCFDCGTFEVTKSSVGGVLDVDEAGFSARLCSSVFVGEASIGGMPVAVDVGNSASNCGGNVFGKSLTLTLNFAPVTVQKNVIAENLAVNDNFGGVSLSRNIVGGQLDCNGNDPAPTGSQNIVSPKLGQCAGL